MYQIPYDHNGPNIKNANETFDDCILTVQTHEPVALLQNPFPQFPGQALLQTAPP